MQKRQNITITDLNTLLSTLDQNTLLQLSIQTLKKKPSERSFQDLALLQHTTKDITFFHQLIKKHGTNIHFKCCQYMEYEEFKENDYICHQGEVGTKFYIILSGSVAVFISSQKQEINTLYAGASFGEISLLTSQPRNATIKCKEKCSFAILQKQAFKQILYNIRSREIDKITTFLSSVTLFSTLTKSTIRSFIYNIQEHTFYKGQVIYNEDEIAEKFYIIKSGEILLNKSFESQHQNDKKIVDIYLTNKKKKKYQLASLCDGEIFGIIECMIEEKRQAQAVCQSRQATVYSLKQSDFIKRVQAYPDYNQFLSQYLSEKIEYRNNRIIQIYNTIMITKELVQQETQKAVEINRPKNDQTEVYTPYQKINSKKKKSIELDTANLVNNIVKNKKTVQSLKRNEFPEIIKNQEILDSMEVGTHLSNRLKQSIQQCEYRIKYSKLPKNEVLSPFLVYRSKEEKEKYKTIQNNSPKVKSDSDGTKTRMRSETIDEAGSRFYLSSESKSSMSKDFYCRLRQKGQLKKSWRKRRVKSEHSDVTLDSFILKQ